MLAKAAAALFGCERLRLYQARSSVSVLALAGVFCAVAGSRRSCLAQMQRHMPQVTHVQDCLFFKESGMNVTNWHSDARLTPLDTNDFVTFWIPLRPMKAQNDSGLVFARGSHRDMAGIC